MERDEAIGSAAEQQHRLNDRVQNQGSREVVQMLAELLLSVPVASAAVNNGYPREPAIKGSNDVDSRTVVIVIIARSLVPITARKARALFRIGNSSHPYVSPPAT